MPAEGGSRPVVTVSSGLPPSDFSRMSFFLRPVLKKLFQAREQQDTEMVKPFLDHLEDLRWTLIKMVATLGTAMVLSFGFRFQLMHVVLSPYTAISDRPLLVQAPTDSINVSLTLSFYAGIVLSFPLLLYFLAGFILPALSAREKSFVLPGILVSFGLFLGGVLLCFKLILPMTLRWLLNDAKNMGFQDLWNVGQYFAFASQFVLIFGLLFELPVVVIALVKLGLLQASTLRKTRAYAVVIILLLSAFIAPSPDPITLGIVAGPMLLLYEFCIWIAWYLERRERRALMRPTRTPE